MKVDFVDDDLIKLYAENDLERRFLTKLNMEKPVRIFGTDHRYNQIVGMGLWFKKLPIKKR